MRENILKLLDEKSDLPPFPEILHRLEVYLLNPNTPLPEIVKILETDAVLVGKLLKIANSVFYAGGRMKITSLQLGVGRLGLNSVREVVYSLTLPNLFKPSKLIDHRSFWRHSLVVAIFNRELAKSFNYPQNVQDIAYLTGLFHDTGLIVLTQLIPRKFELFLEKLDTSKETLEELEQEEFGITHAEIGALYIQKQWELDPMIVDIINNPPIPSERDEEVEKFVKMLKFANGISNSHGITNGIGSNPEIFNIAGWDELELPAGYADSLMKQVETALAEAETLLFA